MAHSHKALPLPTLVVHADWGAGPAKRWMARASLRPDGRYLAFAPESVGDLATLLARLKVDAGPAGPILLGFDFPIGLPLRYAERAGVCDFLAALPGFGLGDWAEFYDVAERPDQINLRRPFYPLRAVRRGQARVVHLLRGLGLVSVDDLRRRCELARPGRRAAAPLFWTVGGQQVGKAAISGWSQILGPALRSGEADLALWPFSGRLFDLFRQPGRIVIAETYPAEYYARLGVTFARRPSGRYGKRVQSDRAASAPALFRWARGAGVKLTQALRDQCRQGFGGRADGEDCFDAVVGLLGMLAVALGHWPAGEPEGSRIAKIEGWILGQPA